MKDQFTYREKDIHEFSAQSSDSARIISALILLERESPGLLKCVLRTIALAGNGWRLVSASSDPEASLMAQRELDEWLTQR